MGTNEDSLTSYVELCTKELNKAELKHSVSPMGSIVEGSLDECMNVLHQSALVCLRRSPRVIVDIKLDVRPGRTNRLHKKMSRIAGTITS